MRKIEIISRGRCVEVTETQLEELRQKKIGWFAYCQKRLTLRHDAVVQQFNKS